MDQVNPVVAVLASATVVVGGIVANAVAAAAEATKTDPAMWIQGGSAVGAVAALGYIARMLTDGRLVARGTVALDQKLMDALTKQMALTDALTSLVTESHHREDRLWALVSPHDTRRPPA